MTKNYFQIAFVLMSMCVTVFAGKPPAKGQPFVCEPSPLTELNLGHGKEVPVQFTYAQPANVKRPIYLESHYQERFYRQYFIKTGEERRTKYDGFVLPTSATYGPLLHGFFGSYYGPLGSVEFYDQENDDYYYTPLLGTITCNGYQYWVLSDGE